ncbi:MAG: sigma-70 family RNA polymerase sigma factor [Patescibacteria group bacterium]|nr:sigma-70 family RNA polymerase sigma factor [Patescibacteria group bacterium]
MHTNYQNPAIRKLRDQQVRYAPRRRKLEQVNKAEKLLSELDPERTYTYEYLCFRVTKYRPESYPDLKLTGEEARHDLRLFVEDVSESASIAAGAAGEPVMTVEELAKEFNVSTKTISRWREQGLVSRRFVMDGRTRLGFLKSSVERFVSGNPDRVQRGGQFSQLTDQERQWIVARARRLALRGGCPAEITKRLALRLGRSTETVRYTLKQFDRENPQMAVFPDARGTLSLESKRKIHQDYQRGESAERLAKTYYRTVASIYRIVSEMRARRIVDFPLDFVPNDEFQAIRRSRVQTREVLGTMPESTQPARKPRLPSGLPPYLASLYEVPLLTREQEEHLFRKMNYLKYLASRLREKLTLVRPRASLMDKIESLNDQVVATKNQIVRANLRLVVSIAKRHVGASENFFELVSDGNMSLMRAVEKFDYGRGNKFSTYATWAIMKNFARTIPDELKHRDRFRTSTSEMFATTEDGRSNGIGLESAQQQREAEVQRILGRLDEREQEIIVRRFGLRRGQEPLTLKQVGQELGVTKERIRQIETRALSKLKQAADEEKIELPV